MSDDKGPIEQIEEESLHKTPSEAVRDDLASVVGGGQPTEEERQALDEKVAEVKEERS